MTPQQQKQKHNNLRIEVKVQACKLDLDSNKTILREELAKRFGKKVSVQTLSMAFRGYRMTTAYVEILLNLKVILNDSEFIHRISKKDN